MFWIKDVVKNETVYAQYTFPVSLTIFEIIK
jgi:hypothetical protein